MLNRQDKIKLIIGIVAISLSLLMFLAFNSHWTNNISDQSDILSDSKDYLNTQNIIGGIGSELSEFFIRLFGVSAYLIVSLVMTLGLKILFPIKKINTLRLLIHHIFFLIWFPLFLSQFSNIKITGQIGLNTSTNLIIMIGQVGLTILLIVSLLLFIIIMFNISLTYIKDIIHKISNWRDYKKSETILNESQKKKDIKSEKLDNPKLDEIE